MVCIAGPTASGKSAWAVSLAKKYAGEIINADALQVYADLRILSARPDISEMENIPHHLFGHVGGDVRYSVGDWINEVTPIILDILGRHKTPILVGGTGLYFKALTQGLANIPNPSEDAVQDAHAILTRQGIEALRARAQTLDPVASEKVLGHDPQRLLRIVSVALGTKAPLSVWQQQTRPVVPPKFWLGAALMPERAALYTRINARFKTMISMGGAKEVANLSRRNLSKSLPVMKAIGVPQLLALQDGSLSEAEAIENAQRESRRFAKRQFTWSRGQMRGSNWNWLEAPLDYENFENKLARSLSW